MFLVLLLFFIVVVAIIAAATVSFVVAINVGIIADAAVVNSATAADVICSVRIVWHLLMIIQSYHCHCRCCCYCRHCFLSLLLLPLLLFYYCACC